MMDFSKYEATGNDFIMLDGMETPPALSEQEIRALCNRRTGVGADGLITMLPSESNDIRMRIFNADGTEAETCGNGIRAMYLFALDKGTISAGEILVETAAGPRTARFLGDFDGDKRFTVNMGKPAYRRGNIPMEGSSHEEAIGVEVPLAGGEAVRVTCVSMGNPHCVVFVESLGDYPVAEMGSLLEKHGLFPKRTNVEFAKVIDKGHLAVRVWERGAGETLACGTGACASLVAAMLNGLCDKRSLVSLPGGDLEVNWDGEVVFLSGPARHVFDGTIEMAG